MLSIYPGVSQIYTPRGSFHLRYPCISVHPPSLRNNLLGGRDRASFGDALGGRDRVNGDMHLEAAIDRVWRCTGRPRWSELTDALRGRDWSSLEMHWEAVIDRVWRCTCRVWSSEIGGVLGGGRFAGRRDSSWVSIHWLTCNCGNVESWVQRPPRDEKLAGRGRLSILGWCCTWCMLYSVLIHDDGMER